jgi:hypothetical protein
MLGEAKVAPIQSLRGEFSLLSPRGSLGIFKNSPIF